MIHAGLKLRQSSAGQIAHGGLIPPLGSIPVIIAENGMPLSDSDMDVAGIAAPAGLNGVPLPVQVIAVDVGAGVPHELLGGGQRGAEAPVLGKSRKGVRGAGGCSIVASRAEALLACSAGIILNIGRGDKRTRIEQRWRLGGIKATSPRMDNQSLIRARH